MIKYVENLDTFLNESVFANQIPDDDHIPKILQQLFDDPNYLYDLQSKVSLPSNWVIDNKANGKIKNRQRGVYVIGFRRKRSLPNKAKSYFFVILDVDKRPNPLQIMCCTYFPGSGYFKSHHVGSIDEDSLNSEQAVLKELKELIDDEAKDTEEIVKNWDYDEY